jgi:hypothetical protein
MSNLHLATAKFELSFDQPKLTSPAADMSANALNKIAPNSPSRQSPSEIETSIANASFPPPMDMDMRPQD